MSTKKSAIKKPTPLPEQEKQELSEIKLAEPRSEPPAQQSEKTKPLTLASLNQELQSLKHTVDEHSSMIKLIEGILARKRKPVASNGKVQIRDKQTGTVYPSKNNAYQSLLKSGELKELVDKGIFGPAPEKNTFGWYTLVREWPDRFEEVPPEEKQA